jgi:hypothetical protein
VTAPLTHVCPLCEQHPSDGPHCICNGAGALTEEEAKSWAADGEPMPRELPPQPAKMKRPCVDCAFRHGSPERDMGLDGTVKEGRAFYCHQGMAIDSRGRYVPPRGMAGNRPIGAPVCAGFVTVKRRLARGDSLARALRPVGRKPFPPEVA